MNILVSILLGSIEKTWAEPRHLNIHNKVQYMNCYESLTSHIKKANRFSRIVTILADNFDFEYSSAKVQ